MSQRFLLKIEIFKAYAHLSQLIVFIQRYSHYEKPPILQ